jgi:NAD-dependent DNA ligase
MRKLIAAAALGLSFIAGAICAGQVRDWHDLDEVHKHVLESIHEMEKARAANHYDMDGHGIKAEDHLRQAEHELHMAVEAARAH